MRDRFGGVGDGWNKHAQETYKSAYPPETGFKYVHRNVVMKDVSIGYENDKVNCCWNWKRCGR